jgi:NadR type nicotinamide-nucleotide adenylyltransferase
MKKFRNGLIIGKFSPLHKGHELLIETALEQCETLYIFSYYTPEFARCETHERERWLRTLFPTAKIHVIDDNYVKKRFNFSLPPSNSTDLVERRFAIFLWLHLVGKPLDAVFTSEKYGEGFVSELNSYFANYTDFPSVQHVLVDLERKNIPISGTQLRANIHDLRHFVSPVVYASFVERVCLLGGESSGKSTLAKILATAFNTNFVEEYGRTLSEEKENRLEFEDLLRIAKTHIAHEEQIAETANRYLFIDTSPLTTLFYSKHIFDRADPELEWLANRKYDRTFLCAPDFKFVQDGTREGNGFRERQHQWYLKELMERKIEFTLLTGTPEQRLVQVRSELEPV